MVILPRSRVMEMAHNIVFCSMIAVQPILTRSGASARRISELSFDGLLSTSGTHLLLKLKLLPLLQSSSPYALTTVRYLLKLFAQLHCNNLFPLDTFGRIEIAYQVSGDDRLISQLEGVFSFLLF